jgi:hypothetical protein
MHFEEASDDLVHVLVWQAVARRRWGPPPGSGAAAGRGARKVADRNDQLLPILNASSLTTTATTLRGTVNPNPFVPTVTFTVTIAPGSCQVAPNGIVTVLVSNTVLGTTNVHVVNGVTTATFTVAFFAPGDYTFTAVYSGSAQFQGSFSNAVTVHVS